MNQIRKRLTYANVMSSIAVFLVLGGATAFAATQVLPKNSVGAKQLKKEAVTASKIKNGAVTASKINPTGLTVPNATHATTADNATHATTADNATNATNATTAENATALAKVTYVQSASIVSPVGGGTVNNPSDTAGSVTCPTGTSAVGGGFTTSGAGVEINESQPTFGAGTKKPATGWNGFVDNFTATARTFTVWAICVKANTGNTE
ncbi:MAG TPA: hypothetical protein VII45_11685 [Solirubrobacterales bacterium]